MLKTTFINYVKVLMNTTVSNFELEACTDTHFIRVLIGQDTRVELNLKGSDDYVDQVVVDQAVLDTLPNGVYRLLKLKETRYTHGLDIYSENTVYMRDAVQVYHSPFRIMREQVFALFRTKEGKIKPVYYVNGNIFSASLVDNDNGRKTLVLSHDKIRVFLLENEGTFIQFSQLETPETIPSLVKKYKKIASVKGYDFEEVKNGMRGERSRR